jgi:hypothetical protein
MLECIPLPIAKMKKPSGDSKKKGILTPEQFINLLKTLPKRIFLSAG